MLSETTATFAGIYMGLSPGYAFRNMLLNYAHILIDKTTKRKFPDVPGFFDVPGGPFCKDCPILKPKERKQKPGDAHWCRLYDLQVFHMLHHPNIVRLSECVERGTGRKQLLEKQEVV